MFINSNGTNYQPKQNFTAKVKSIYINDAVSGLFGHGLLPRVKPLLKDLADNKVTFRVADVDGYGFNSATDVVAETKHNGKIYRGRGFDYEFSMKTIVEKAKEALEQMNLHIRQHWDVKTEKKFNDLLMW